ncbi:rhomboid family intramembrane serine protease [Oscillibacter sp. MSJ-2]|uniref:Rhomboid family intramembrane serine protease n=2 Tax=Dysosmobacter acutus TaxID=2841504 RepID=A0ABS6FBF3_9FIRM|nr:rhomboid family intramembrane serine protease [Dysosmobacter acutus]
MMTIVIGNAIIYLLARLSNYGAISFLSFDLYHLLHGELWRLLTFLFVPNTFDLFSLAISLYFYYFVGSVLEREWGTAKFTLYYLSGAVLTLLATVAASLISGNWYLTLSGTYYVNMSMFFAFAMLYPDMQVLLFFIIPLKVKWLAWANAALFAVDILRSLIWFNLSGILFPLIALFNFFVFFAPDFFHFAERKRYQHSRQSSSFRKTMHKEEPTKRSYRHKCAVCGRTDADHPELQFRYCSRCTGYHCYCQDHIFNHVHFTDDQP